ncbi:MAG: anaerobic ribonucleoside-triphosphate reductase activating protein [Candidatus Eisenbacteria bacterium]|nr:anaerobic ribonucleoside-triphosphate reductase activating protein [Candidatus Eisenbacteria bacterium]
MKHAIKGFDQMSLVDWDGMVAATLYTGGCNFRCPFCHNSGLVLLPDQYESIPADEILEYVKKHNDFIDGVVITGGEPCIHSNIGGFIKQLRNAGVGVKLDTNGSFPKLLESLIDKELVDYVAMDVKAPLDFDSYSKSAGITDRRTFEKVRDSIDLLMEGRVDYEFRMTVVPALHRASDLQLVAEQVKGARRFVLQNYVPRDTLDPAFLKETPYDAERLEEFKKMMAPMFDECLIRGES